MDKIIKVMKKKKCKICNDLLIDKKKKVQYCSMKCFKKYLNSKEFDIKLNKALNIKNEKSDNI